jgi:hypothetical protein
VRFRFNWNAAIAQDPFDKSTIYFGSQFLHRSTSKGASWQTISPDLTTNDSAKIDQSKNGGLSLDITGAENFCTILTIAPSPLEKGVIWVGTDDGNVQLTRDGGRTWMNFRGKIPGMPVGGWIPQIQASRHVAGEAFVVCNDYRRGDMKPYIFRTSDYGKTWTRMVDEKKVTGYTLCVLQDPTEPNLIFTGSEQGLWVSLDNGITFERWKHGFPPVSTFDMAIQEREADLVIATFGRSIWVLDNIRPLRAHAAAKGKITKPFMLYPPPTAVQAQFTNPDGYEWSTWGLWEAQNRSREASISWFSDADTSAAERKKKGVDSIRIRIMDAQGRHVRELKMPSGSGFNRQYWGMESKGTRMPGSPKPKPGAPEYGGQPVMPGRYTIVASLGDRQDTTLITVADDPRLGDRTAVRQAQQALRDRLMQLAQPLTDAMDRLSEAEEAAGRIETAYKDDKGAMADSIRKSTKAVQDSIKTIREFISGKRSTAQGYGQVPRTTVMSQFQQALQAIGARPLPPAETEQALVEEAGRQLSVAVGRIEAWLGRSWPAYQELVKAHQPDPFRSK